LLILGFAVALKAFPATGFTPLSEGLLPNLRTTFLPALTLALAPFAFYTRLLRGDMIEQLTREEYVVLAAAKGLTRRRILFRHVLTNSLFPLLAMVGLTISLLAGGSVVVENVFGIPGVGQVLIRSINSRDVPVVQAVVVVIALVVVLVNLLIEALYGVLDPRIRHERAIS
jgi:peptide/nickel transport system permease protein